MTRFHRTAFRHGISEERALHVIVNCPRPIYEPNPVDPGQENVALFLGPDQRGIPLEVVALEVEAGLLVIHAMRLRRRYVDQYLEVNR